MAIDGNEEVAAVTQGKELGTLVKDDIQADNQQQSASLALDVPTSNKHGLVESKERERFVAAKECIVDGKLLHLQTFLQYAKNPEIQPTSKQLSVRLKAYKTELLSRNYSSESNRDASVIAHSGRSPEKHRYEPPQKRRKQAAKPKAEALPKTSGDQFLDEEYDKLMEYGLDPSLVVQLIDIYKSNNVGKAGVIDRKARRRLTDLPLYAAHLVMKEFLKALALPDANPNMSALLCGIMTQVKKDAVETSAQMMENICKGTGYPFQDSAEEKVYGPPSNLSPPPSGCEIECSQFPKDAYLDELILLCEDFGPIYEARLFMEQLSDLNQGYACVKFTTPESAEKAMNKLNGWEIRDGLKLQVAIVAPEAVPFGSGRSLSSLLPNVNLSDSEDPPHPA